MKTKKCGVYVALAAVLLITAMLVITCTDPVIPGGSTTTQERERETFTPPPGKAAIRIKLPAGTARTLMPEAPTDIYYSVAIVGTGSTTGSYDHTNTADGDDADFDGGEEIFNVIAGTYSITVGAHTDSDLTSATLIAAGQATATVGTGGVTTSSVTLGRFVDGATHQGTFSYAFTLPVSAAPDTAVLTIVPYPTGAAAYTSDLIADGASGSEDLDSAFYWVTVALTKAKHADVTYSQVLHIYGNQTTEWKGAAATLTMNKNRYDVTYKPNGNNTTPSSDTVDQGGVGNPGYVHKGKITETAPTYTRTNFTFLAWRTNAITANGVVWDFGNDVLLKDTDLFASWQSIATEPLTIPLDEYQHPTDVSFTFSPSSKSFTQAYALGNDVLAEINIEVTPLTGLETLNAADGWYYGNIQITNTATLTGTDISSVLLTDTPNFEVIGPYIFTFRARADKGDGPEPYSGTYTINITEN
jgi:hypothetical protein